MMMMIMTMMVMTTMMMIVMMMMMIISMMTMMSDDDDDSQCFAADQDRVLIVHIVHDMQSFSTEKARPKSQTHSSANSQRRQPTATTLPQH